MGWKIEILFILSDKKCDFGLISEMLTLIQNPESDLNPDHLILSNFDETNPNP